MTPHPYPNSLTHPHEVLSRFDMFGALCRPAAVLLVVAFCALATEAGELRVWTSANGEHSIVAELVRVDGNAVVLRKPSGEEMKVPLAKLSRDDQRYAERADGGQTGPVIEPLAEPEKSSPTGAKSNDLASYEAVEAEASKTRTADDAVLVYEFALAGSALPPHERKKVRERMEHWLDLAEKGYVRLGKRWTTKEEADEAKKGAKKKIDLAIELLRLGNGPLAAKALRDASKTNPNSIEADFITGVLYGLMNDDDLRASRSFEDCLDRDPGNVAALNNLAVSQFFSRKHNDAAENWCLAATFSPETEILANNLGCMLAVSSRRGVRISKKNTDLAAETYASLLADHGHERPDKLTFFYMLPERFKSESEGGTTDAEGELITVSSGSGFVVAPNVIMTNKHVTEGGENFLIVDPRDSSKRLPATLIAESAMEDLALVRCPDLDAAPVPLCTTIPYRGSDIMVLGYPLGPKFGLNLKSTRGAIVATPENSRDGMLLYDAITNPGNSGGPLCDQEGRVIGIVRAISGDIGGVYGMAIPAERALPFLRRHEPTARAESGPATPRAWTEVDARVAPSTVLILNRQRTSKLKGLERRAAR